MSFRNRILPVLNKQELDSFYSQVVKKGNSECWQWSGIVVKSTRKPYFKQNGLNHLAYRLAYYLHYRNDPHGYQVWHTCHNSICCNPSHLTLDSVYVDAENLSDEVWLPVHIADFSDDYSISNYGRIRRETGQYKGHISRGQLNDNNGYLKFVMRIKPKKSIQYLHRLVACAFLNNGKNSSLVVNHKDGIKTNNHVSNLELVTFAENIIHSYRTGMSPSGQDHTWAKLTTNEVIAIRDLFDSGKLNINQISKRYQVTFDTIKLIVKRQTWKHV